jgi:hypothetical protein
MKRASAIKVVLSCTGLAGEKKKKKKKKTPKKSNFFVFMKSGISTSAVP